MVASALLRIRHVPTFLVSGSAIAANAYFKDAIARKWRLRNSNQEKELCASSDMNSSIRAAEARVVSLNDIKNLIDGLPLGQKEQLVADLFSSLPEKSQGKIPDLGGVNVVIGGSNFAVNASLCIQIQNVLNVDIASIIEAAAIRHKRDRESKF